MKKNLGKSNSQKKIHNHNTGTSTLKEVKSSEETCLKVTIPYDVAEKLYQFLREKGLTERYGLPIIILYGLSGESEKELGMIKLEMESQARQIWENYYNKRIHAYWYSIENWATTMKLRLLLSDNKKFKKRLKEEGIMNHTPNDEWDDWDEETITGYYNRYVFSNHV